MWPGRRIWNRKRPARSARCRCRLSKGRPSASESSRPRETLWVADLERAAEAAKVTSEYVSIDGANGMQRLLSQGNMEYSGEMLKIVDL